MRRTLSCLLAAAAAAVLAPPTLSAQPTFVVPKAIAPDADTLKQIEAKTAELKKAIAAIPRATEDDVWADVEVYAKAAEWIVRHGEWFTKDSGKQTLTVLNAGLERAKAAAQGKTPWRDVRNRPVIRGYRSRVDGSVQPFSLTLPEGYRPANEKLRLDVVLHGRDQTLTEVKFIAQRENAKPAAMGNDFIVLEPYGRGNNAYRWAGEADVFEAMKWFARYDGKFDGTDHYPFDLRRVVLRGFSMGGAGTWHIGLHHPFYFAAIGPGAGFTTTRGYIKNLPEKLPDYQEKCLRIYDAVNYAENAFNVPVVAYSGEKDPQKAAADNIENALKGFNLPLRFTHLVAPGLEHQMPAEWQAKAQAEYAKALTGAGKRPERLRFVTYTVKYNTFRWGLIEALDRHYEKAVVDSTWGKDKLTVTTTNVRTLQLVGDEQPFPPAIEIDGQSVTRPKGDKDKDMLRVVKVDGKWQATAADVRPDEPEKRSPQPWGRGRGIQGPIDDAFGEQFAVVPPLADKPGWHPVVMAHVKASQTRFSQEWDKFFRGSVQVRAPKDVVDKRPSSHLVLFGDPESNPAIDQLLDLLPITWTKEKLVVNGVEYDPKTHVPVLIYPHPLNDSQYVVINSGHTFHAAELQGTNAQLYPRLGDWAVLKPTPTAKDPAAAEVVAAGLFDEFWQFPKKK